MTHEVADTDARIRDLLVSNVEKDIAPKIEKRIAVVSEESKMKIGEATKYYPYLSKAEVKLKNTNKKVLAKLPHRFMGDLIDFFIPAGTRSFCETLKEPCLIPRAPLQCLVLGIKDEPEYFLVDYYLADNLVGIAPPKAGNVKLTYISGTNENYIEFGESGLNIVSNKKISRKVGEFAETLKDDSYASSDTVYTKDEVYTKQEVDELIRNAIEEALGE